MGFMDGIRDVLGGFNAVKRIDDTGFDWREKDAAEQAARNQLSQRYQQENEDYLTKAGSEAAVGGMPENELDSLLPAGLDPARRRAAIARMVGQSAQAKSSLEDQKTYRDLVRQDRIGEQRLDQIGAQGANQQALARVKADIEAGRQPSPRDLALIQERGKIQEGLFDRAEAGRNYRAQNFGIGGRGGRPQLRLVSDGKGGTEYRWIAPGETAPGAPTATQRETAGMAGNISDIVSKMEEIAPDVTYGPIFGRASEWKQSQYPSGKEAEFDQYVKQLVDLAYIKSGKQINKQELEMQLRGMISRSKGDLPGQVSRAKPYIENILKPYEKSGAIQSDKPAHGPAVKKRSLPNGKTQFRDAQGNVWEE